LPTGGDLARVRFRGGVESRRATGACVDASSLDMEVPGGGAPGLRRDGPRRGSRRTGYPRARIDQMGKRKRSAIDRGDGLVSSRSSSGQGANGRDACAIIHRLARAATPRP